MRTAPPRSRSVTHTLTSAWRQAGRPGRWAVAVPTVVLAVIAIAVAGLALFAVPAQATTAPLPVPASYSAAIHTAALSCPVLTPPRLAAQLMAASGFDPRTNTREGAAGIAGLTDPQWRRWRPGPGALRGDAGANILALAHNMCDLAGQVRAAGLPGELWTLTLAAYRVGLPAVVSARGVPAGAIDYVNTVSFYADWYTAHPDSSAAAPTTPRAVTAATPTATPRVDATAPTPVPGSYVAAVVAAGRRCSAVTAPLVAAHLMAESGFNPNMLGDTGAQGIAQFRPDVWSRYRPSTTASAWDPDAAIRGLGAAMCDLVDRLRGWGDDPYRLALVAFHLGIDQPSPTAAAAGTVTMRNFVQAVSGYADVYAKDTRLNPAARPGSPSPAPTTPPGPPSTWQLTWSDEFTGAAGTRPDSGKWKHDVGGDGWGNNERQYYTDSTATASLDGTGNLVITAARSSSATLNCWYGPCQYTSARLATFTHFAQAYGRISARIKLPKGQGIWPSFWALGDNIQTAGWPQAGELNIMNSYGNAPATVMGGLHGPSYDAFDKYTLTNGTFADAFHTFSVDWYPDHVTFSVDGQPYHTKYRAAAGAGWVFDHPFFLLLNVAVGGRQPGDPNATTVLPQRMLVDWVRVYRAGPPATAVTGQLKGLAGKCAEVAAPAGVGWEVALNTCNGSAAQRWTLAVDGTVRAQGGCLDIASTSPTNGTHTTLAPCRGAGSQVWLVQTNGQLFNPASGRCLDVTSNNSADHTLLQVWECWGAANQRWTIA